MNERFSHRGFDRIVGLTPEMKERSNEVYAYVDHLVDERGGRFLEGVEVEKTEREREISVLLLLKQTRFLKNLGETIQQK